MAKSSIIYVDGFNLYYGAKRGTPHKWLDLETFFERLRQDDHIQTIKYFTAEVDGTRRTNQQIYLAALTTCPKVQIILGRYKYKQVKCGVRQCNFNGGRFFRVPEEKRTDVSIAIHMLDDAHQQKADRLIIISGDSDLVPSVAMIKHRYPDIETIVYVPARDKTRGAATELRSVADKSRTLPQDLIARSQFPGKLPDGQGGWITKPAGW